MKINDAFIMRNIYGRYILMPIRRNEASNDPVLLNDVAAAIWNAVQMYGCRKEVYEIIKNDYGLKEDSPEWIAVEQFVEQMITMGLLIDTGRN